MSGISAYTEEGWLFLLMKKVVVWVARKNDESLHPEGRTTSPKRRYMGVAGGEADVTSCTERRVWSCDPTEDPVCRPVTGICGAANPEAWECQEAGETRQKGRKRV